MWLKLEFGSYVMTAKNMENDTSGQLLADLFDEYSEWYMGLAAEYGSLPRSLSGLSKEGGQFIYLLDDLELHHMIRNKYLRYILDELESVVYAYGGIDLRGDSDAAEVAEVLSVSAADSENYITGDWRVVRDEDGKVADLAHLGTRQGNDPEEHPGTWFMAGSVSFSALEKSRFGALWDEAKPGVIFRDRNREG